MTIYSIYKATNTITGKCYIGFDSHWPKRKYAHNSYSFIPGTTQYDTVFHRAVRKYGKDSFTWEVIYQSSDQEYCLHIMEPFFIKEFNSFGNRGYNMTVGGDAPMLGKKHSNESKKKMSRPMSEEHKRKISEAHKGKPGRKHSTESLLKMSELKRGEKNHNFGKRWGKNKI